MILKRLVINNFRQFRGIQEIEFASSDKNVTVVFGENGRGKTGIFRAIMFCLFGDRRLSQDGNTPEREIQLVNTQAIHDAGADKAVDAFVELRFSHKNTDHVLKREILGMQSDGVVYEELKSVVLNLTDPSGNTKIIDDISDINAIVNGILDRRVREYFLFDGEKIERLTRASDDQRREIKQGIRNLLNVDSLENAITAAKKLVKNFESELDDESDVELLRIAAKVNANEEAQERTRARLLQLDDEISKASKEKQHLDEELEQFNEIKHLVEKRNELNEQLAKRQADADFVLLEMKQILGKASGLLISDALGRVYTNIDQRKQRGEIPPQIRAEVIDKILADGKCICGRDVCEGTEQHDIIVAWRDATVSPTLQQSALDLWSDLKSLVNEQDSIAQSSTTRIYRYANIRNDVQEIRQKLTDVSEQIGSSERQDAQKLEHQRTYVEGEMLKMEAEKQRLAEDLVNLTQEFDRLRAQRKEKEAELERNNELSRRWSLARDTKEALEQVYREFTLEIKEMVGEKASSVFHSLIDAEGQRNLASIVVNDDYSLQMLDKWGKPFLANISAGQRQIMSIAFIAALANAASTTGLLEMPLFMDTPFGRLSFEHRRNLLREVPSFASQWILLATDTEFRRQEAQLLSSNGSWGKFYMLRQDADGNTEVREHDIAHSAMLLREGEGKE